MTDADRFRLLHGPYRTPRFRYGHTLRCELRGELVVTGLTDAPVPWPLGRRPGKSVRARSLVLCGDLADAVRRESATAVAYHWGITAQTVTRWRQALGVGHVNEGTHRLRSDLAYEPGPTAGREKGQAKNSDPGRRAKIAAAKRGKPRPPHVVEAMRKGRLGTPHSAEARAKMSAAHKFLGTRPPKAGRPWTPEEDRLVRKLPAAEVARKTSRSLRAVWSRRRVLGLPDGRTREARASRAGPERLPRQRSRAGLLSPDGG
jgi:hypothetical protein